jgi:hypothetical protein
MTTASAGGCAQGRGSGGPTGNVTCGRAVSAGAPRGRGGRPEGCGALTGGQRPASACVYDDALVATRGGNLECGTRWRVRRRAFQHDTFRYMSLWPRFSPDFETKVHWGVKSKVVDLTTLYNFYKGSMMFFSTVAQTVAKLWMPLYSGEQALLQLTKFSTLFQSKFEIPSNMKVVSLEKLDNFYIGRFWSV